MKNFNFTTPKGTVLPVLDLRGKAYLEVKFRLVWFREERPNWMIRTIPVELGANHSIFRAEILDEEGRVIATSHKKEDAKGFPDHMEKAESGAIGRALALIGYGTQFCGDELDEGDRIVDSPAGRGSPGAQGARFTAPTAGGPASGGTSKAQALSDKLIKSPITLKPMEEMPGHPLDNYVIRIKGKLEGKTFKEVGKSELEAYAAPKRQWYIENKKPIPKDWQDFFAKVEEFCLGATPTGDALS